CRHLPSSQGAAKRISRVGAWSPHNCSNSSFTGTRSTAYRTLRSVASGSMTPRMVAPAIVGWALGHCSRFWHSDIGTYPELPKAGIATRCSATRAGTSSLPQEHRLVQANRVTRIYKANGDVLLDNHERGRQSQTYQFADVG